MANSVDQVTVSATPNHYGGTVSYLDGDDMSIADADDTTDGFQVSLAEGENTIKAQVSAEITDINQTYTIGVARAINTTPPTLSTATVDGMLLVLTYDETLDSASVPPSSAYSVSVNSGAGANPSGVAVDGKTVTLTLATAVFQRRHGDGHLHGPRRQPSAGRLSEPRR